MFHLAPLVAQSATERPPVSAEVRLPPSPNCTRTIIKQAANNVYPQATRRHGRRRPAAEVWQTRRDRGTKSYEWI